MSLSAGTRLGPYEVLAPLGAGGMGEVYKARDSRLDRDVAIKVLPEHLAGDPVALSRFEREAKAVAAISHPNILAIHDFGTEGGVTFAVTELLEGETLRSRLAGAALPWREAVELAAAVADGLAAAHSRGIVHRDLKPENLFLTSDGRIKILDFGLARRETTPAPSEQTTAPTATQQTMPGTVMGTVGYMSPEQVIGSAGDARSDIFSFGCVLYEMTTGVRTFSGRTGAETLSSILRDDPPDPRQSGRELPADIVRVILHCLRKEPDQRFQSARDLSFNLKAILAGAAVTAPSLPPVTPPSRALRWTAAAGAVIVVLLAAGVGIWRLRRESGGAAAGAIESLAVLPFANSSNDPEAEYLGDGFTESLIDRMSRVPSLKVMARGTVRRFKGTADPQDAGRKLGVRAVLTGAVARHGNQLAISAELLETSTGARLWGEDYDKPFSDLLRVQDSIALGVASGLNLELSDEERRALGRYGTRNPEAYELYLKARYFFLKDTEEAFLEARKLYQQALEKDPKFVEAHLGVAASYSASAVDGWAPPTESWQRADEEIRKALELDPENAIARNALAIRRFYRDWNWAGAERELQELATDPRVLLGEQFRPIGLYFWAVGRTEDAVALMERALRVDPGNLVLRNMMGNYLAQAGRLEDAIRYYNEALKVEPSDPRPLFGLAEALKRQGDVSGAIAARRKAYELSGEEDGAKALAAARTAKDYEDAEVAVARFRLGELEAVARERYVSPLDLARLQAQVGEREKAFASLEAAFAERSPGLVFLKVERAWDRIRDDPRFAALVRRVGIP